MSGFHIHDTLRPAKPAAAGAPVLPVIVEEPPPPQDEEEEEEGDFSADDDDEPASEGEDENGNDGDSEERQIDANGADALAVASAEAPPEVGVKQKRAPAITGNPKDEMLQLLLEEAFFLMYGLGVLSINDETGVFRHIQKILYHLPFLL